MRADCYVALSMKSTFARTVFSIWSWFVLGVVIIVWTPMVAIVRLVTMPFDKGAYAAGYLFRKLTVVHERLTPLWKFRTSGTLPDDMRRPYVVVSNHESFVDILLISHLPTEMKWMSKIEILRIPLVGWMMKLARDIPLERGDADSTAKALAASSERLNSKVSVMIFPEGTRSKTGELARVQVGRVPPRDRAPGADPAARRVRHPRCAAQARLATRQRPKPRSASSNPSAPTGLTMDDMPALRTKVRDLISAARDDLRREFGE